jgi:plasmid maintenance system antidote protein VapI
MKNRKKLIKKLRDLADKINFLIPPGRSLQDELTYGDMSVSDFAEKSGLSKMKVIEIIKGETEITLEIAQKIAQVTEIPEHFWLNGEELYKEEFIKIVTEIIEFMNY